MTDLTMPPGFAPVHNRYMLPSFVERTSYGVKESNPYNKIFEDRIIFLGVQIDDASANDVMAQLLTLESHRPGPRHHRCTSTRPVARSPRMTAIYDTMQYVRPDISTVCLGPGGQRRRGAARRRHPGQADGAAALADHHPPAGHRGRLRPGLGHRDPGPRDHADAHASWRR